MPILGLHVDEIVMDDLTPARPAPKIGEHVHHPAHGWGVLLSMGETHGRVRYEDLFARVRWVRSGLVSLVRLSVLLAESGPQRQLTSEQAGAL